MACSQETACVLGLSPLNPIYDRLFCFLEHHFNKTFDGVFLSFFQLSKTTFVITFCLTSPECATVAAHLTLLHLTIYSRKPFPIYHA